MKQYETITLLNGLVYAATYPLLLFKPKFLYSYLLLGADYEKYHSPEVENQMAAVFLSLMVVIVPAYITASMCGFITYIDLAIVQRITIVFASIFLTVHVIKQDVFEGGYFSYSMFLVGDIVPAFLQIITAPGGRNGIKKRLVKQYNSTPPSASKKSLCLEAYMGMVFGFIACIYAAIVSDVKQSLVATVIVTFLPYVWFYFLAHEKQSFAALVIIQRLAIAGVLFYYALVLDFGPMNIVYQLQAVNILVGVTSSETSALMLGLSSLVLYKLECDYVLTLETGCFWWLCAWGIITCILSSGWKFLFYAGYNEKQKKRITGTFWQDYILGAFNIVVGGALQKAKFLVPGTLGGPVIYLLPPVTLWFSLETKLLTHLWVGTPFHPSWWIYGSTRDDQSEQYAKSDWINVTFSLGTALITIILTSYAWFATSVAVGFDAYLFSSENTWKFAVSHGILFIFHSGLWMIIASSGVPHLGLGPAFQIFPPKVDPLFQCDPKECIRVHKLDLVLGHLALAAGAFFLDDGSGPGPLRLVTKATIGVAWLVSMAGKAKVHSQYRLYEIPYFEEQKAKKAE